MSDAQQAARRLSSSLSSQGGRGGLAKASDLEHMAYMDGKRGAANEENNDGKGGGDAARPVGEAEVELALPPGNTMGEAEQADRRQTASADMAYPVTMKGASP